MAGRPIDFICVLRGSSKRKGLGPALRAHLERHPRWGPNAYWKPESPNRFGRVRSKYGFNLFVAQGDDWNKVQALMKRRLRLLVSLLRACSRVGGTLVLDVAAMPGPRWFTRSVRLPLEDRGGPRHPSHDEGMAKVVDTRPSCPPLSGPAESCSKSAECRFHGQLLEGTGVIRLEEVL